MMPPEGQNKSDEQLQRYAKERRERGGDFSLHPATRQLLQGEVARQYGKPEQRAERRSWWGIFLASPARWVVGGALGVIALTCLVVWNGQKRGHEMQLAQAPQADTELLSARGENRSSTLGEIDKDQRGLLLDKKKEAGGITDEVRLALNEPAQKPDSLLRPEAKSVTLLEKPLMPVERFGSENALSGRISTNVSAAYSVVLQTNATVAAFNAPTFSAQDRGAFGVEPLGDAYNYATALNGAALAKDAKMYGAATGGGLAGNRPALEAASRQQPLPQQMISGTADAAKREVAFAEKLGRPIAQSSVATRSESESLALLQNQAPGAAPAATPAPMVATAPAPGAAASALRNDGFVTVDAANVQWERLDNDAPQPARFYRSPSTEREIIAENETRQRSNSPAGAFRVLDRFAIEQQANAIRVVDEDGSIYEGTVDGPAVAVDRLAETVSAPTKTLDREKAVAAKEASGESQRGYSFRASGSNVTLKRFVEVSGKVVTDTNATSLARRSLSSASTTPAPAAFGGASRTQLRRGGAGPAPSATNSAVIEGVIRIGKDPEQRFRAAQQGR